MDNTSPPLPYSFRDIPAPHSPYSFTVISSSLYDNYSPRTSTYLRDGYISLINPESEAEDEEDDEDENTDDKIAWEDVIPVSNPEIAVNDAEEDAVSDGEEDAVSDAEEDAVNDAEEDAVSDAEEDAVSDGEEDAVSDAEEDAVSDAEEDAVSDTAEDALNDTVHPLNGHIDGKLDQSEIKQLKADYATVLNILLGMKAKMDQISNVKLPKKVRFDPDLPEKDQINHPNSSRKRKSAMTPCIVPQTKKRRQEPANVEKQHRSRTCSHTLEDQEVNVRPIRATVDGEFTCLWQRGKSGKYCWVSDPNGTERKELDGEFLFLHSSMLSVELRGNGDWQPISVRLNEKNGMYEGRDSLDSNTRMEIDANTMFDLLCGSGRSHVGHIEKLR